MSDEDIATALSKLSIREMQALDAFIDAEADEMNSMLMKREAIDGVDAADAAEEEEDEMANETETAEEREDETALAEDDADEGPTKRCNCPKCQANRLPANSHFMSESSTRTEREVPWAPLRTARSRKMTADQRIEAKMNFLRDKNKRQLASKF